MNYLQDSPLKLRYVKLTKENQEMVTGMVRGLDSFFSAA
jgi:hypothetical protein